ncbi:MAG: hypothetical protein PQJ61_05850 [Spirochaetales bacterium]|uniref:Outer membrane protein beta-barrel domain-containing protein n=1 Tax=Candidatus Thalassospirochaeta sargassi TaxID=3119039 RepID=A0AAJ1IED9_9SPIO|nr:hypothetical protein [Spirochaetales bacterium]
MKKFSIIFALLFIPFLVFAEGSLINHSDSNIKFFLETELGTTGIQYHTITIGDAGTADTFNFVTEGGQEILYPFERFNLGMTIKNHHRISFLYQPLEVVTESVFEEDRTIDGVTFTAGTEMEMTYSFPFYRITYAYDFFAEDNIDLGLGAALQLRNASIIFKQLNGEQMTVSQNLGLVPALNFIGAYRFNNRFYLSTDITGSYASSAFFNGADFEFAGSLLDASLRTGYTLKNNIDLFLNLRFIGGSASGTSGYDRNNWTDSDSPTTSNYLATTNLSFGLTVR